MGKLEEQEYGQNGETGVWVGWRNRIMGRMEEQEYGCNGGT